MFIPILIASLISSINAASIVSRSQSYPLSQPAVLGPKARITIGNKVIAPDGFERSATLVDGIFPGPLITAQKGDDFAIEVVNELKDESMFKSTSVHWHGIYQNGTNYADGTSFVTQCPIAQNHSFLHTFSAPNQAGTYWYHSHYSVQYCDGLRGPLVIYDPDDPLAHMYDVDDASTVITLSDWYHVVAPVLRHIIGTTANSSLINGRGRYAGGPMSDLAVINVEQGKRYRLRLVAMSCDPNFLFSIDGHNLTVIEADGQLTEPLVVDQLQIFAGQRYSVVLIADQRVDNFWMRSLPNLPNASYVGGTNSAILRYRGAPNVDPTTVNTPPENQLQETDLHALINPGAPGIPEYGKADINLNLSVTITNGTFYVNNVTFKPPTVPVLLQILSGAQEPSQLLPNGSVFVLGANKVVELTLSTTGPGGPHPIHLHGHAFDVVQSAGNKTFNYVNPVRRDVVNAGSLGQQMVIRWVTDNSGPWFLHCHIDWHLDAGFAVVMAESPSDTRAHLNQVPHDWDQLCPTFDSLSPSQLGGGGRKSYEEAASITTLLFPPSPLP
ncbi:multicopper oxidase [Suillus luteus UH-Slu-Lm8-n1]|uniref:Multicopper oxidase n=1 Tax=Suillus luteus UH-Slu-Lm8-n1 TaxID=930992 RepID=A0A0C9ZWC7_9AGAM|nr:multicopper oxidase [Suillus luteus UH-Slu-Lm8-n1]